MESHLRDLESQLYWCWHWYLLRVWQDCGSFDSASNFDRLQIAEEMRADAEGRSREWALAGLTSLVDHLLVKLDDPDPTVREEAVIGLGDYCPKDHPAIDVLIEQLRLSEQPHHDRACAAWALGQIKAKSGEIIPLLLTLIEELKDQPDADELRFYSSDAIENLTGEIDVLVIVAQLCLGDRDWQCRMRGLFIAERLIKRQPDLRGSFVSLIEPHLKDELDEIQDNARRILDGV